MFGLTDPLIWGAYAACAVTVVLCAIYWFRGGKGKGDGDE